MGGKRTRRDWETFKKRQDITPPPHSNKLFRSIELNNGLSALLVSDPDMGSDISRAAVSMSVRVGSYFDPPEAQGLAHFVEHMLFLGSDRFPEENSMESYLKMHGGDSNGTTYDYHATYHLFVLPNYLEGTLERFSRIFVAPLLKPNAMNREICAVDSEFELCKQRDPDRLDQLRRHTSRNDHSYNRFTCGNKVSLCSESKDALHIRTKAFFDDHYHASSMKLCVIGGDTLAELDSWVRKYFGCIKDIPKSIHAIKPPKPIWNASTMYVLESVEGMTVLRLAWILPPYYENNHLEMPEVYFLEVLSNEGKESLFALFKKKGWVIDIKVHLEGHLDDYRPGCRLFTFELFLTNSGLKKKYEIVSYIYQYIKLLIDTTPQQWVWKQYWKIKKFEFDCLDISGLAATSPTKFATYLSGNMLKYPMRHVISADYVHKTWNPKAIKKLMKEFTPNNMRIDLTVNSFKATDFKTERWFATRFIEEQIPKEITEKWGKISEVDTSLQFLKENPFLPTAFTPRVHSTTFDHPKCIVDKSLIKMWHQCAKKGSSYAFLCINLNCGIYTAKKQLTMDIYKELLEDELGCVMFEGNQANLSSSLSINENKLVLQVSGYREKLSLFLSELWKNVRCFSPSSKRFKSIKAQMVRELKDMDVKTQSEHLMVQMLCERSYGLGKKLRDMKQESFASLKRFIRDMYSQISVEGFCYGDVLEKEAYDISKIFESTLKESSLPQVRNEKRILRVPRRAKLRRDVIVIKKSETNSMVKVYFQIGNQKDLNEDEKAMLTLFNYICEGKLYNQLRTQEQLGYDVHCCTDLTGGVYGFCVHIVSSQYNPNYLLKRIYQFVNDMRSQLEDIPQENLEDYKESVSSDLCNDVNSKWDEIVSKRYNFERRGDEGIYVDLIEKEELIKWYDKYIRELSPNCRKFAICIWGCNTYMMKNSERHHVKIRKKLRLSSTRSWTRLLQRK